MMNFKKIIILSKQIASSLLKDKSAKELETSNLFSEEEKEDILKRLTEEDKIESRLHLKSKIDSKADWQIIKSKLVMPKKTYRWQYAAAAAIVLGVLSSTYFLKGNSLGNNINAPIIVDNQIEPGIDKALLTLESGEVVELVKGVKYEAEYLKSEGEELVYQENLKKQVVEEEISFNYLSIPKGGQFQITLEDGTHVWLNSESKLKYPVYFIKGNPRLVELVYGEAYFDVSPSTNHNGAKFQVISKGQNVEVLGTEFNIKAYQDEVNIYTTLVEGKVEVSSGEIKENLIPKQQSILNIENNVFAIAHVDVYNEIAWKDGVFNFENKTLKDIMMVLSRWYDIDVAFEKKDLETQKFIGALKKNYSIEKILTIFQKANIINSYEINKKSVIIK
ncbi:FecR family protein [Algibacter sp. L4_22]|uniref:FecR family protein n=1 Tax=Algibacter sp. L4_22 TaxID=2942477 RepID=UPI00201B59D0|nr:FecR family protein [Algibacter sp. L4_22]MCL5129228.1 FecR family protein [Algibacter sp. L4_22]